MIRNRNNSQKPPDELLANFKASFPGLNPDIRGGGGTSSAATVPGVVQSATSLADASEVAVTSRPFNDDNEIKDMDPTPRASVEQWRFTPSLLDPNSFAFTNFANQPPGYYTPTPGGTNTIYHPQAGDLHTPGFVMGLGTPLSMPTSEGTVHAGQNAPAFGSQGLAPHVFQNPNPFAFHHGQDQQHAQPPQTFAPHQFTHHPQAYDTFQAQAGEHKMDESGVDVEMGEHAVVGGFMQPSMDMDVQLRQAPPPLPMDNFRYHLTLNAPTAMIKHPEEIPVTYLNKGQAYSISIVDTKPTQLGGPTPRYRTYIRISFEDEEQRQKPASCWSLWKEGRGTNEAHHRGGRLQAVEFVDPNQTGTFDQASRPRIELECASFDGFAVTWSPVPNGNNECSVAVRFNFLSTDFSHSKGVKGIPVRLCAKTQLLPGDAPVAPDASSAEICYCKVKLFRDHGAERKLSNDVAHVKKTIDKLKQQIAQMESGMKDFGKRKRSSSGSKPGSSSRPGKVPKHKRTWSMSSTSDTGTRGSHEEDLQVKLAALQDMFSSQRPASVLFLRGEELDDPDLHPVHLSGEPQDLTKVEGGVGASGDTAMWEKQSTNESSIVSPTPSVQSLHSNERRSTSGFQQPAPFSSSSRMGSNDWQSASQTATGDLHTGSQHQISQSSVPIKVPKVGQESENLSGWIESIGVDLNYQPPQERLIKPIACFYIQPRVAGKQPADNYYRAVYLMQRTLNDLVNGVAIKSGVEPSKVLRTVRINSAGLNILMDDDTVTELREGQDMIAEFTEVRPQSPMKREWDSGPTDIQVDGELDVIHNVQSEGYDLRLHY